MAEMAPRPSPGRTFLKQYVIYVITIFSTIKVIIITIMIINGLTLYKRHERTSEDGQIANLERGGKC